MKTIASLIILLMFLFAVTAQIYGADWEKIYEDDEKELYLNLSNKQKLPNNNYL